MTCHELKNQDGGHAYPSDLTYSCALSWIEPKTRKSSHILQGSSKDNFPLTQLPFVCSTWRFITAYASSAEHEWRSGSQIRENTTPLVRKRLVALEVNKRPRKIIKQNRLLHAIMQIVASCGGIFCFARRKRLGEPNSYIPFWKVWKTLSVEVVQSHLKVSNIWKSSEERYLASFCVMFTLVSVMAPI